jgi:O-antigen ligase
MPKIAMFSATSSRSQLPAHTIVSKHHALGNTRRLSAYWAWLVCPTVFLLSYVPVLNHFARGLLFAFLFWFVVTGLSINRSIQIRPPLTASLLWISYAFLVSASVAADLEAAMAKWVTVLTTGLLGLAVFNAVLWSGSVRPWASAFIVSALLAYASSYFPLSGFVSSEYETEVGGRAVGTLANANTFGRAMSQGFIICLGLLLFETRRGRSTLILLAMGVLAVGVLESNSRTAMLGLLIAVLAIAHCLDWRSLLSPSKLVMVSSVVVVMCTWLLLSPDRYTGALERIELLTSYFGFTPAVDIRSQSLEERAELASSAFETFTEHPFGIGLDNFRLIAGKYAHSNFLEVLVSTGLIGLLIYYSGLLLMGRRIMQRAKRQKNDATIAKFMLWTLISILIMDLTNVSYYSKVYWVFLGLACGIHALGNKRN